MQPRYRNTNDLTTLLAKLTGDDIKNIKPIIESTVSSLSANQMFQDLKDHGIQSAFFIPTYSFLSLVEAVRRKTYKDPISQDMTLGIGLDLTVRTDDSELDAIFTASFNSGRIWNLKTIRTVPGWPEGGDGLDDDEISRLLLYTLIGVTNKKGTFVGLMPQFINQLKDPLDPTIDFRNTPFRANQLIALQSLTFNRPDLLGKWTREGLQRLVRVHDDLGVLIDLIENCNLNHDAGLQNRRLKEAALFHGKSAADDLDIHLTVRQYQRIFKANEGQIKLLGGPVIWGIPSGDEQKTFQGGDLVEYVPSFNEHENDNEVFGSRKDDVLTATTGGSPVLYGGYGNDVLVVPKAIPSSLSRWTYVAGNEGKNFYILDLSPGYVFIYDVNYMGSLVHANTTMQGIATAFDGNDTQYNLPLNGRKYVLSNGIASGGLDIAWGDQASGITVSDFVGGELRIVLANYQQEIDASYSSDTFNHFANNAVRLPNGNYCFAVNQGTYKVSLNIVDSCGNLIKTVSIGSSFALFSPTVTVLIMVTLFLSTEKITAFLVTFMIKMVLS
ncbi:MAG: hypothetical protein M1561_00920 [Gammaproteobacteria bacterium]|nr:hypothetical protein [Gammaproteobacteria bacterium]